MITQEQKDNRAKLLAALRSGEYAQVMGALKSDSGYCCLGVAEDLRGAQWEKRSDSPEYYCIKFVYSSEDFYGNPQELEDYEASLLTDAGKEFYGFSRPNPRVNYQGNSVTMTMLNDGLLLSFEAIADVLESQDWWEDGTGMQS